MWNEPYHTDVYVEMAGVEPASEVLKSKPLHAQSFNGFNAIVRRMTGQLHDE